MGCCTCVLGSDATKALCAKLAHCPSRCTEFKSPKSTPKTTHLEPRDFKNMQNGSVWEPSPFIKIWWWYSVVSATKRTRYIDSRYRKFSNCVKNPPRKPAIHVNSIHVFIVFLQILPKASLPMWCRSRWKNLRTNLDSANPVLFKFRHRRVMRCGKSCPKTMSHAGPVAANSIWANACKCVVLHSPPLSPACDSMTSKVLFDMLSMRVPWVHNPKDQQMAAATFARALTI